MDAWSELHILAERVSRYVLRTCRALSLTPTADTNSERAVFAATVVRASWRVAADANPSCPLPVGFVWAPPGGRAAPRMCAVTRRFRPRDCLILSTSRLPTNTPNWQHCELYTLPPPANFPFAIPHTHTELITLAWPRWRSLDTLYLLYDWLCYFAPESGRCARLAWLLFALRGVYPPAAAPADWTYDD